MVINNTNTVSTLAGVDGFKYSTDCWASIADAYKHEEQLCMPIDEREPRYNLILEALTQEEINPNIDIDN